MKYSAKFWDVLSLSYVLYYFFFPDTKIFILPVTLSKLLSGQYSTSQSRFWMLKAK